MSPRVDSVDSVSAIKFKTLMFVQNMRAIQYLCKGARQHQNTNKWRTDKMPRSLGIIARLYHLASNWGKSTCKV